MLVALRLLALEKQLKNVRPITIGEVIYQLVIRTLAIQFKNTFAKHFSLHLFGVATLGKCKTMVHAVRAMLDLCSEWGYHRWMFKTCLINILNIYFLKVVIFYQYFVSKISIYLSILCTPISTIFLKGF